MKRRFFLGLSLAEVIVAISIFTIVMAGFSLLFIRSVKSNTYILEMGRNSLAVSRGVEDLVRHIREAKQGDNGHYAIVSAGDNDLKIYADFDNDGRAERLHFYLDNQQIKMGITRPQGDGVIKDYASEDEETIIKASHVLNSSEEKLFHYYDSDNNLLDVATGDISNIRMIEIFLEMNIDPNRIPDNLEMRSFVNLRNLSDYDRIR